MGWRNESRYQAFVFLASALPPDAMMYMMYNRIMVRKQLYIEEQQERALKNRAKALGVSEAELVRQALNYVLKEDAQTRPSETTALNQLFTEADNITQTYSFEKNEQLDRQSLYEADNRHNRW